MEASLDEAKTWTQKPLSGFSVGRGCSFGVGVDGTEVGGTTVGGMGLAVMVTAGDVGDGGGCTTVGPRSTSVITSGVGVGAADGEDDSAVTDLAAPYPRLKAITISSASATKSTVNQRALSSIT